MADTQTESYTYELDGGMTIHDNPNLAWNISTYDRVTKTENGEPWGNDWDRFESDICGTYVDEIDPGVYPDDFI